MNVLVVEDMPAVAALLREKLADAPGGPFEVVIAADLASAIIEAGQRSFDVVLLDLSLPDSSGIATVERLHAAIPSLPIVVKTGLDDEQVGIEAMAAGAQDYLIKGHSTQAELSRSIRYAIARGETEQELIRARTEADRANRAKSEFLSRMSHELRTPLNAILGFGQLLELDLVEPANRESVHQILVGGRHLLALINEVLDIAKIEADLMPMSLEATCLTEAISEATDLVSPLGTERQITLEVVAWDEASDWVVADVQRFRQVLLNLLTNAVKYNIRGGSIHIACAATDDDGVLLSITDTGRGISEEGLAGLFEPFNRLGAETDDIEGTGLGLALSRRLVEGMGGRLSVTSEVAVGSTFSVWLQKTQGKRGESKLLPGAEVVSTPIGTVLYVEDNVPNLVLMQSVLRLRPHLSLLTAPTGEGCLDLARARHPDLIILDLELPDMNGREVLSILQADVHLRTIPVIVVSGDAMGPGTNPLASQGAAACIPKPINVQRFLSTVDDVLQRSPLTLEGTASS